MALAVDISRAVRSRAQQHELVRAVFDSAQDEQETHYMEWKGSLNLVGKDATGRATIAKAVLGFANRDPNAASRAMGGCAYLLVGVSPGQLTGVEAVDGAQLEARVATYVGRNVDWRADYVAVDDRSVLVVTVEPPQWGDPVHPVRKTFNPAERRGPVLQEGTVFVRHQASTDPATAADLDMLSRRAARRPGDQLDVDVRLGAETELHAVAVGTELIEEYCEHRRSSLLAPLESARREALGPRSVYGQDKFAGILGRSLDQEFRTEEQFREEVSRYIDDLRDALPSVLRARAVLHGVARLKLEVHNQTDATFSSVRVEVRLPAEVWATEWQEEVRDQAEPPEPPVAYGQARRSGLGYARVFPSVLPIRPGSLQARWRPDVERRADAVHVEYVPEDVRAQGVTPLPSLWLLLDDPTITTVEVRWEATATNAEKRLTGVITVPVSQPPAGVAQLLADLPEDD